MERQEYGEFAGGLKKTKRRAVKSYCFKILTANQNAPRELARLVPKSSVPTLLSSALRTNLLHSNIFTRSGIHVKSKLMVVTLYRLVPRQIESLSFPEPWPRNSDIHKDECSLW